MPQGVGDHRLLARNRSPGEARSPQPLPSQEEERAELRKDRPCRAISQGRACRASKLQALERDRLELAAEIAARGPTQSSKAG